MKSFLCFDLETAFVKSGFTRGDTKILEIALKSNKLSYQRLVNPLKAYQNGKEIIKSLDSMHQHPQNTINFWTKLLIGKKALPTNVKRKNYEEKADAISKILIRSDIARKYKDSSGMMQALARNEDDEDKAKEDIRTHDKTFDGIFYTVDEAITGALEKAKGVDVWCAHNGKAFDEKVLKGHDQNFDHITFVDSLHLLKRLLPGLESYSQPMVYDHIFKKTYRAHHALDDATALLNIMNHVLEDRCILDLHKSMKKNNKKKGKVHKDSNLYNLKGIGTATVEKLYKKNITTKEQLLSIMSSISYEKWCKEFSFMHRHKMFYETHAAGVNSAFV